MSCENFRNNGCCKCDNQKIEVVKENKSKFQLNNPEQNKLCVIRVDGCLIQDGKKCDYLILECDVQKAFFVELKGKDILHAIDQIESSIDQTVDHLTGFQINARVVLTKVSVPNIRNNPKILRLERRLKLLNSGTLKYSTIRLSE